MQVFLGSHIIDKLMENNEKVICLDNYITGKKSNIEKWINHPNFEIIKHDVTFPIELKIDRIWHLASPASPVHYQSNPIKTSKTIFLGTYNLLELAKKLGQVFYLQVLVKFMVIQKLIPRKKVTKVQLIQLE